MKNDFCSYCGTRFDISGWPRTCPSCGVESYLNPMPVVIILQPVMAVIDGRVRNGVVVGQRAIEPKIGEWSLISGYIDPNETAEEAARREFRQETSLELMDEPRYAYSSYNDRNILMLHYYVSVEMPYETFLTGKPCPENFQLGVKWSGDDGHPLAFPLQSEFTRRWFAGMI